MKGRRSRSGTVVLASLVIACAIVPALMAPAAAASDVPVITVDPVSVTVTAKQPVSFHAEASGATAQRWEASTDHGQTWKVVPDETGASLTFTAHGDQDGNQYRSVFTSGGGSSPSAAAVLGVDRIPVTVTTYVDAGTPVPVYPATLAIEAGVTPAPDGGTVLFRANGLVLYGLVDIGPSGYTWAPPWRPGAAGSGSITAEYSGDADHLPATSAPVPWRVGRAPIAATLRLEQTSPLLVGATSAVHIDFDRPTDSGFWQLSIDGVDFGAPGYGGTPGSYLVLPAMAAGVHVIGLSYNGGFEYLPTSTSLTVRVYTNDQAYVLRLYQTVLDREPDPGGLVYWAGVLARTRQPSVLGDQFARQADARTHLVDLIFQQALRRHVDPSGAVYWTGKLAHGLAPGDMLAALFGSQEAFDKADGDVHHLVTSLYQAHFGRTPDATGLAYWSAQLAEHNTSRGRAAIARSGFGLTTAAARAAIGRARNTVCGSSAPGSTAEDGALAAVYRASGQDQLRLVAATLAQGCP